MLVEDVMSTNLVTCGVDATLREGAHRMLEHGVGSVIVCEDGIHRGIVTETDALAAGYVADAPFSEIPIRKVMSTPLETITRKKTIRRAAQRMKDEGIKKLVVIEDMEPVGIITAQDIVGSYHDLKKEVHQLERADWNRTSDSGLFDLEKF